MIAVDLIAAAKANDRAKYCATDQRWLGRIAVNLLTTGNSSISDVESAYRHARPAGWTGYSKLP